MNPLPDDLVPRPRAVRALASLFALLALTAVRSPAGADDSTGPPSDAAGGFNPFAPPNRVHVDAPAGTRARIVVRSRSGSSLAVLAVFDALGQPLPFDLAPTVFGGVRVSRVPVLAPGGVDLAVASSIDDPSDLDVTVRSRRARALRGGAAPVWVPGHVLLLSCIGHDPEEAAQSAGLSITSDWGGVYWVDLPSDMHGFEFQAAADFSRLLGGAVFEPDAYAEPPEGSQVNVIVTGEEFGRLYAGQRALRAIGVSQAPGHVDGTGVTIAILDTGIDRSHPLFAEKLLAGFDFVDGDDDPSEEGPFGGSGAGPDAATGADFGHGTFVAGLALAVAPGARILPVRVLNSDGLGTASGVAAGIRWAVDHDARVINLSLGTRGWTQVLADAVVYANSRGAIVVAAAGNRGRAKRALDFPSNMPDVIAVTALGIDGHRAGFSNGRPSRALAAPGTRLIGPYPGGTWGMGSGTSFAAPLVSGAVALVLEADEGSDAAAARQRLSTHDHLDLRGLFR